jgi:hypothetical protein
MFIRLTLILTVWLNGSIVEILNKHKMAVILDIMPAYLPLLMILEKVQKRMPDYIHLQVQLGHLVQENSFLLDTI